MELYSSTNIEGLCKFQKITNGPEHWLFAQLWNAPRGIVEFNLYCYKQERPDLWSLHGYVPVHSSLFTNGYDQELAFKFDENYLKVVFRGDVVFTAASKR